MSRSVGRRKSSLKAINLHKEPPGPILKFKWSLSAAHLALLQENTTPILPSVDSDRIQRPIGPTRSSIITDSSSISQLSRSTHKSLPLPSLPKQSTPSPLKNIERKSARSLPLKLTFTQLHHSPAVFHRPKQSRLSICPAFDQGSRENLAVVTSKLPVTTTTTTRSSIVSTTTISLLAIKADPRSSNEEYNRLNSPQLRRLNVSEKYINEAKKLFYNPEWKVFTPRSLVAQVF